MINLILDIQHPSNSIIEKKINPLPKKKTE